MAILKIAKMGHPLLLQKAKEVRDPTSPEIKKLVNDMFDTLNDLGGSGVGLAAPQVHISLQIVIFEAANENETSLITLINPKIEVLTKETSIDWEGCLSVPGLRGKVSRPNKIKYTGLDIEGNKIETIAEGFNARVVQHECDHLFGVLYPQRMKDLSSLQFVSEARHWKE
ncbi:MAG: peptide deformylase [Alphaproteobacteria bacterium]|tara:strand:+ start:419 stop:928 length:510 start_codon:yes stop_codon:yes gene_type:complete